MKKVNLLLSTICIATIIVFTSCAPVTIPFKGNYDETFNITSDKPIDEVWSNIIDIFAQKGVSIGVIDKSSGLITSGRTSFLSSYTFEDNNGQLEDKYAFVVVKKLSIAGQQLRPSTIYGTWNVRLKNTSDNKTNININLIVDDVNGQQRNMYGQNVGSPYPMEAKSTHVFERLIAELIK